MARKIIWWYLYSFSLLIGAIFHLPSVIFDAFFSTEVIHVGRKNTCIPHCFWLVARPLWDFFCAKQVSRSVDMIDKFKSTPYSFIPLQSKKVALRKMSWKSCHWVLETLGRASHVVWSSVMKTLLDSIRITKNTKKRRWKCCLSGKKNMLLKQLTRLCILPFAMSL